MQYDKIDKRRLPNIEYKKDGKDFTAKFEGGKMPLEQVLSNTDKSMFLIADGGVGKSTTLRALWLDSLCATQDNNKDDTQKDEKHKSYIYVDLKLLDDKDNSTEENAIYRYVNNSYCINLRTLTPDNDAELILLLDGANEASSKLREKNVHDKCKLVQDIEEILRKGFRIVISSRSRDITMHKPDEREYREQNSEFGENDMLYCKLGLLDESIIKKMAPNVREDSALYKLLRNNMILKLYLDVKQYIDIDQDRVTAGKLLDLYFNVCFKTRYVKNALNLQDNERKLYNDKILIIETKLKDNLNGFGLYGEDKEIFEKLKNFRFTYDYLVENSFEYELSLAQMDNSMDPSVREHLSILQKSTDDMYVWGNEIYQQYFRAKKCANAIKAILENNDKGVQNLTCVETIKSFNCHREGDYEVVQYTGEILDVSPDNINQLFKNREKYNDDSLNNYERFVVIMSVLIGNGLPEGLESICRGLFSNCNSLTEIIIPNSVTKIEWTAFGKCKNLKNVIIPNSVTSIESFAFEYCTSLTSIIIPNSVTRIELCAFTECTNLQNVTIKDGGKMAIMSRAFEGCSSLSSIQFGDSVESIGMDVFCDCSSLESINIPATVTSIGKSDYDWPDDDLVSGLGTCSSLTSIIVDDRNTIYYSAGNCIIERATGTLIVGCKNSIIPNDGSVISIRGASFNSWIDHNNMRVGPINIIIPESVTRIDDGAFCGCNNHENIFVSSSNKKYHSAGDCLIETESNTLILGCKNSIIPNDGSVVSIGDTAFCNCYGLTTIMIPDSITSIGECAFHGCSSLKSIKIGNGVEIIDEKMFKNCGELTAIELGDKLTNFKRSYEVFTDCKSLESITVSSGNKKYHSAGNCLIETESKTLMLGGGKNSTIPNDGSVTSIGEYAFCGRVELTNIVIPNSITYIGSKAFGNCRGLTDIAIPDSVVSYGAEIFFGCNCLESITVPYANIGRLPFGFLFGNTHFADSIRTRQPIVKSDGSRDYTNYYIPSSLKNVTITGSKIAEGAFANCSGLTHISLPNNIQTIERITFAHCKSLKEIEIPKSVTKIGYGAFVGCTGLESITIPFLGNEKDNPQYSFGYIFGGVEYVGGIATKQYYNNNCYLFYLPSSLKNITVTGGYIKKGTFSNCDRIASIVIGEDVIDIEDGAFEGCTGLTSVTIPAKFANSTKLFVGCPSIKKVEISSQEGSASSCINEDKSVHTIFTNEDGEQLSVEQTYILYEKNGVESLYVVMRPSDEMEEITDNDLVVLAIKIDKNGNIDGDIEEDEEIVAAVIEKYKANL